MSFDAIVLAGGASERMGRPKAALRWGERSFTRCVVELAARAGASKVVVVFGAHDPREHGVDDVDEAQWCANADWPHGPLSSLQAGLTALGPSPAPLLVLSVDRPHVAPATVLALLEAARAEPDAIVQPRYEGRTGHPIVFPASAREGLLALDPERHSARDLVRSAAWESRRRRLDVEDAAVVANIDDPRALDSLPPPP